MFNKCSLIRVVVEGERLIIDESQKRLSRGAYICKNEKCIMIAQKRKAFHKGLGINISDEFLKELMAYAE